MALTRLLYIIAWGNLVFLLLFQLSFLGVTFKIVTLTAAVEEGVVDLINDTFYDGGSVNVEGVRIKCWKRGGHGAQTFLEVVQNSCNLGVTTRTLLSSLITP